MERAERRAKQKAGFVVISCVKSNIKWALWLAGHLSELGYNVKLTSAQPPDVKTDFAFYDNVVVVASRGYLESKTRRAWLQELVARKRIKQRILPVRVEPCELGPLADYQALDLMEFSEDSAALELRKFFPALGEGPPNEAPWPGPESERDRPLAKQAQPAQQGQSHARTPQPPPLRQESVHVHSVPDVASAKDALGFEPYVEAIGAFLSDEDTKPPLTVSIEGAWGAGKSSFMKQLAERLRPHGKIVEFSAWLHDKDESVWASFALDFVRAIRADMTWKQRLARDLRLVQFRMRWGRLGAAYAVTLAAAGLAIAATVGVALFSVGSVVLGRPLPIFLGSFPGTEGALPSLLGWGVSSAALVATSAYAWAKVALNPVEKALAAGLDAPGYGSRISFAGQFHEDFGKVLDAYVGSSEEGARVYVFVDDLDRCDVPRAAEVMQAINLMIGTDPRLVFILGMDREKVAAGLAVKHQQLLPYLSSSLTYDGEGDEAAGRRAIGIDYGYDFIEKFVQVPFRIPQPNEEHLQTFIASLTAPMPRKAKERAAAAEAGAEGELESADRTPMASEGTRDESNTSSPQKPSEAARRVEAVSIEYGLDSPMVAEMLEMVAPILDHNPRRLKQFLNLFRLRLYIAGATGLFHEVQVAETGLPQKALTPEQIAKFVAIGLRWPLLLAEVEAAPSLLKDLEHLAVEDVPPAQSEEWAVGYRKRFDRWARRQDVLQFLRIGHSHGPWRKVDPATYALQGVATEALLRTSARVARPAPRENVAPVQGPAAKGAFRDETVVRQEEREMVEQEQRDEGKQERQYEREQEQREDKKEQG